MLKLEIAKDHHEHLKSKNLPENIIHVLGSNNRLTVNQFATSLSYLSG